ncbi:MAG: HlyD family secretion protein, partial [Coriobacteriaceae bacterium]|nr:HlyD family secretion protein [Coriobacteriaceae bacterium]
MSRTDEVFLAEITDSKEVMQAYEPPVAWWFLTLLSVLLILVVIFLFLFQRDVSVSAQGVIEPVSPTETVVSAAGGRVGAPLVADGSVVEAGDVLVELDVDYAAQQLGIFEARLQDAEADIV